MSNMNSIPPSMLRIDTSRSTEYVYEKPKLSFFQKLGRGIGKALSFLGPIGAAVTAVAVPGFGIPLAAGIYGASKIAGDVTANALAKDSARAQALNQDVANMQITMPGLFDEASAADIKTDFIAPSEFNAGITSTIVNRETMRSDMTNSF